MNNLEQRVATSTHAYTGIKTEEKDPELFGQPCCGAQVCLTYHYLDEEITEESTVEEAQSALSRSIYPIAECPACGAAWEAAPIITYVMSKIPEDELLRLRKLVGLAPMDASPILDPVHYGNIEID